jgi:hypothetical protein
MMQNSRFTDDTISFAASTITHALRGRRVMSRVESPTQRWAERLYHSIYYRIIYIAAAFASLCLALWEPPVQNGVGNTTFLATIRAIDATILAFVAFDLLYLQALLHTVDDNTDTDTVEESDKLWKVLQRIGIPRRGWLRLKLFTLLALSINLVCVIAGDLTMTRIAYPMRILRPILLLERLRNIRALVGNIITTAPSVFNILLILLMQMTFSGALAFSFYAGVNNSGQCMPFRGSGERASCSTFDGDATACRDYFSDLSESLTHLFELSTTSNFPGLIVPAYNCNRWNALFFVAHIIVSVYLLIPLFTAVSYASFFDQMKAEAQLRTSRMFLGFDVAFKTLSSKSSTIPKALVITKDVWLRLFALFRPTMPVSVASRLFDVIDETALGEIDALEFRRALCNFGPVIAECDEIDSKEEEVRNDNDDNKSVDELFDKLDEHVSFKKLANDDVTITDEGTERNFEKTSLLLPSKKMVAYGTTLFDNVLVNKKSTDDCNKNEWGSLPSDSSSKKSTLIQPTFLSNIVNSLREISNPNGSSPYQNEDNNNHLTKKQSSRYPRKCFRACRNCKGCICGRLEWNGYTMDWIRFYRRSIRSLLEKLWVTMILDIAVVVNAAAALSVLVLETDDIVSSPPSSIVSNLQVLETTAFSISLIGLLLKLFSYSPCIYWQLGWVQKSDILLLSLLILSYAITSSAKKVSDATADQLSIISVESNELTSVIMLLRFVRITRILQRLNGWGETVGSIVDTLPVLGRFLFAVILAFFSIAIIGMELFAGLLTPENEAVRTSSYGKAEPPLYNVINFDSLHGSFLCLFTVVVQGDWPMLMEAAVAATGKQARWYFVFCWACINAILLATAIGFIVESFQAYRQKRKKIKSDTNDGFSGIEDWRQLLIESSIRSKHKVNWKGVRFRRSQVTADVYTEIYRDELLDSFIETFQKRRR